jgi:hypothetical protein
MANSMSPIQTPHGQQTNNNQPKSWEVLGFITAGHTHVVTNIKTKGLDQTTQTTLYWYSNIIQQ